MSSPFYIVNVPLESIPMRYSSDWNKWFLEEFKSRGVDFATVTPSDKDHKITHGQFLDVFQTNIFKSKQTAMIAEGLQEGLWTNVHKNMAFFFHDLWHPGVVNLAYMRMCQQMNFLITGVLHAGTWDENDFLSQRLKKEQQNRGVPPAKWIKYAEMAFLGAADMIFVATNYHKELICQMVRSNFGTDERYETVRHRIIVLDGLPLKWSRPYVKPNDPRRKNKIAFPHRLTAEKGVNDLKSIVKYFDLRHPEYLKRWEIICTMDDIDIKNGRKERLYEIFEESKIVLSCSRQETWGIAMQEGLFCGCMPVVPNHLSYPEMYSESFRYYPWGEATKNQVLALKRAMDACENPNDTLLFQLMDADRDLLIAKGQAAIPKILGHLEELIRTNAGDTDKEA